MDELMVSGNMDQVNEDEIPAFADMEIERFAPSDEIQAAEIGEVFHDIPELQFENWEKLSMDERVGALSELELHIAEIAHRPAMPLEIQNTAENVNGFFDGQRIVLSNDFLSSDSKEDYEQTLATLIHEGRHAYQYYNLYSGEVVESNEEKVNAWRVNLDVLGYEPGDSFLFPEISLAKYYTQPIEVDARVYTNEAMRAINI